VPDFNAEALALFASHLGLATSAMLDTVGISGPTRQRLVRNGLLNRQHKGVYRIVSAPETLESRCLALCMRYPAGFITGPTGGKLLRLRRMPSPEPIHICIPHGMHYRPHEGVIFHQSTSILPIDSFRRDDGLVIASWPRLAFDLARDLDETDHASVVEQILADKRCTLGTLCGIGRRLIHEFRAGSEAFATTLRQRISGGPLESHPEVLIARALAARGVPVVAQLQQLVLPNGNKIRIDLAVPDIRWAIEIDIFPDHYGLRGSAKDKQRDRQCHLIGWQVERVTEIDMLDFDGLIDELVELYHHRVSALAA
jgi:very-short-patch-repair endonuclease